MLTSGLIITLQPEPATQAAAVARLRTRPELTLGELTDRWLPAALEARDDAESREVHDWLMALPGVAFVDVVSVNFEVASDDSLSLCGARGEGRGEGLAASALVAAPLIRPSATFSPRSAKGEGTHPAGCTAFADSSPETTPRSLT